MARATFLRAFKFGHWQIVRIRDTVLCKDVSVERQSPALKNARAKYSGQCFLVTILDYIISAINDQLDKIPLTHAEKDFCIKAVAFEKFRQLSIWIEAGGHFGIAHDQQETANSEWYLFWVCPRDCDAPDQNDYHNIHYRLRSGGELLLIRDE